MCTCFLSVRRSIVQEWDMWKVGFNNLHVFFFGVENIGTYWCHLYIEKWTSDAKGAKLVVAIWGWDSPWSSRWVMIRRSSPWYNDKVVFPLPHWTCRLCNGCVHELVLAHFTAERSHWYTFNPGYLNPSQYLARSSSRPITSLCAKVLIF